jgi:simple sugar transport system permease protein
MKIRTFFVNNLVVILFVSFTLAGFILASDAISLNYFLNELIDRVFRNFFLVLSLIIPVTAGLGLNFGIVVGAMAGNLAIIFCRFHNMGGLSGLLMCFLFSFPLAVLFGFLTGKLYNKTRGQEMIASLIVGYFAQGIYYFILLFAVGYIIPVPQTHPLVKFDGVGIRMSVDMGMPDSGGMKYALDNLIRVSFIPLVLVSALIILAFLAFTFISARKKSDNANKNIFKFGINCGICALVIIFCIVSIISDSSLMMLKKAPLITGLVVVSLCLFLTFLNKTKLGQDFRSVGQNQHIAEVSGINVDRTRIIATIFSTVLAAWGMIIYMQNMGTLATYDSHKNIGLFSVAAILVGGASTSRASVKNALIGAALFNSMTIISPELGQALFGDPGVGEFFRSFMVYGVIGLALGLYVWKQIKAVKDQNAL